MMKGKLLLLLATSSLLFTSCTAIPVNNNNQGQGEGQEGDPSDKDPSEQDPSGGQEEDKEGKTEFSILNKLNEHQTKSITNAILTVIDNVKNASSIALNGELRETNLAFNGYFSNDLESIKQSSYINLAFNNLSIDYEAGVNGFDFSAGATNDIRDFIGYSTFNNASGSATIDYRLDENLFSKSESSTIYTNKSSPDFSNLKFDTYLKNGNFYVDFTSNSVKNLLDELFKDNASDYYQTFFISLEDILEDLVFTVDEDLADGIYSIDEDIIRGILSMLSSNSSIGSDYGNLSKQDFKDLITTLDLKFYSYYQSSNKYLTSSFSIDSIDDVKFIVDLLNKANGKEEENKKALSPKDEEQDVESYLLSLLSSIEIGEMNFEDFNLSFTMDIYKDGKISFLGEQNLKASMDESLKIEMNDSNEKTLYAKEELSFNSKSSLVLSFGKEDYSNKLPNDEELAKYKQIDVSKFKEEKEIGE